MKQRIVIYHGGCFDGFTAAWVFRHFFKPGLNDAPVEYFPAHYGQEPPDCKGKEVWLVDFSYPREVMIEKIIKPSTRTLVFDHHKTAEEALRGLKDEIRELGMQRDDKIVFDMHRSGAGILYDELETEAGRKAGVHKPRYNGLRALWLVDYVEDRDLWKWQLPNSEYVSAYLSSVPMTFAEWDAVQGLGLSGVIDGGRAIKRYIDTYGAKAREFARFEEIAGYKVPTINISYMNCSDHVNALAEQYPDAPFAASYCRRMEGDWMFSLRVRKGSDFDVSEVAKEYGGGGHRAAAGFRVPILPWDKPEIVHMGENSE